MTRSPSPWWALLLLPAGLLVGWLAGQMPAPATEQPASIPQPDGALALARRESPRGPELSQWTSLENAIAESRRNGKPVMIDFNADWCGPCRAMKSDVFEGTRGEAVRAAVIPVSIVDRVREEGRNPPEVYRLQQEHGVEAFPTLIVFSPASGRSMKIKGYGGGERTLAWIEGAAKEVR